MTLAWLQRLWNILCAHKDLLKEGNTDVQSDFRFGIHGRLSASLASSASTGNSEITNQLFLLFDPRGFATRHRHLPFLSRRSALALCPKQPSRRRRRLPSIWRDWKRSEPNFFSGAISLRTPFTYKCPWDPMNAPIRRHDRRTCETCFHECRLSRKLSQQQLAPARRSVNLRPLHHN